MPTGEFHERSWANMAQDFVWLAKRRYAEEQRARVRPALADKQGEQILSELKEWFKNPPVLDRAQHSLSYQIIPDDFPLETHVLLIQHDWAAVLAGAKIEGEFNNELRVPYNATVFEFAFRGGVRASCMAVMSETPYHHWQLKSKELMTAFKTKSGWIKIGELINSELDSNADDTNKVNALLSFLNANVLAVCAMLEAEVAETTPTREPYRRNTEPGTPRPKLAHHIVSLHSRVRYTPPDHHEPGSPKRLHFRRGHWRHYPNHRTWIKWTLVGNPDLGFVDKDYRL